MGEEQTLVGENPDERAHRGVAPLEHTGLGERVEGKRRQRALRLLAIDIGSEHQQAGEGRERVVRRLLGAAYGERPHLGVDGALGRGAEHAAQPGLAVARVPQHGAQVGVHLGER